MEIGSAAPQPLVAAVMQARIVAAGHAAALGQVADRIGAFLRPLPRSAWVTKQDAGRSAYDLANGDLAAAYRGEGSLSADDADQAAALLAQLHTTADIASHSDALLTRTVQALSDQVDLAVGSGALSGTAGGQLQAIAAQLSPLDETVRYTLRYLDGASHQQTRLVDLTTGWQKQRVANRLLGSEVLASPFAHTGDQVRAKLEISGLRRGLESYAGRARAAQGEIPAIADRLVSVVIGAPGADSILLKASEINRLARAAAAERLRSAIAEGRGITALETGAAR